MHDTALAMLKLKADISQYETYCGEVRRLDADWVDGASVEDLSYAVAVNLGLKCGVGDFDSHVQKRLKKAMDRVLDDKNVSLKEMYYVMRTMVLKKSVVKDSVAKRTGSMKSLLKRLAREGGSLSDMSTRIEIATFMAKLMGGAKVEAVFDVLFSMSKASAQLASQVSESMPLEEAAVFARAVNKLAQASKIVSKFPRKANAMLAQRLMSVDVTKTGLEPADALGLIFDQLSALRAIQSSPIKTPVIVHDVQLDSQAKKIYVSATDVNYATPKGLTVKRAYKASSKKAYILEDETLSVDGDLLVVDYSKDPNAVENFSSKVGEFVFEFTQAGDDYVTLHRLKFNTDVELSSFEMVLYDKGQYAEVSSRQPVQYPNQLPHINVDTSKQFMEVQFVLSIKGSSASIAPQQVFIHLHPKSNAQFAKGKTYKLKQKEKGFFSLKMDLSRQDMDFVPIDGDYTIEVMVGDSFIPQPIYWNVGQVRLSFEKQYEPTHEEKRWSVRQEIRHIFHPSEKRSHGIVSIAFSGLVLLPLAGFLLYSLSLVGGNAFALLPSDSTHFMANVALQVCVIAMLGVLTMYFIYWRIMTVLKCLISLAGIASFVGVYALRGIHFRKHD